jgi:anti-sigma factor RsiW
MRGKISDQDLTDYALDELDPHERLYVESMLAVSEECRADVYDLIEIGQMIDEGFDREGGKIESIALTDEQRARLLTVRTNPFAIARTAAAVAAAAASVAFAIVHPAFLPDRGTAVHVAQVSRGVAQVVTHAVAPANGAGMLASFDSLRAVIEDSSKWIPEAAPATPAEWLDIDAAPVIGTMPVGMPDFGGMPH